MYLKITYSKYLLSLLEILTGAHGIRAGPKWSCQYFTLEFNSFAHPVPGRTGRFQPFHCLHSPEAGRFYQVADCRQ